MADRRAAAADVRIGSVNLRGQGLSADRGRDLAVAVAFALARDLRASGRIDHLTLRLPATVLTAGGGIDQPAIAAAIGQRRSAANG